MRRTSTILVDIVGCYGDMVTMATVSDSVFLYFSKGIMSKFRKFLSWYQNFSVGLLRFMKTCYHGNRKTTSYSFVSRHKKHKFGTSTTNTKVYNYAILCPIEGKLGRFSSTVRRTSTILVDIVGCYGDMVTMATVSDSVFLYFSKGIMSKFRKFLSWYQNFSVGLLRFMKTCYHGNRKTTSYSFVSRHKKHKFGTSI